MKEQDPAKRDALATVFDAGAVRVPQWLAMVAGLSSIRPETIGQAIDWLSEHRGELERAYARGRDERLGLAFLSPEMCYEPELGFLDRSRDDHALRERYIFADLLGKWSFMQVVVYAISGVTISAREAQMLEELGVITLTADRRAWPLAVTRRIAARGSAYSEAVAGGMAMMSSNIVGGRAAGHAARYFARVMEAKRAGRSVGDVVAETLAKREHVMGFGRPVVGPDERVPRMKQVVAQAGRAESPYAALLVELEDAFAQQKGLRTTAAAWAAAPLCDLGMSPEAVESVCNFWVSVTIYAQAVFSGERGVRKL